MSHRCISTVFLHSMLLVGTIVSCRQDTDIAPQRPAIGSPLQAMIARYQFPTNSNTEISIVDRLLEHKFDERCRLVERAQRFIENRFVYLSQRTVYEYDANDLLRKQTSFETIFLNDERQTDQKTYEYDSLNRIKAIYENNQLIQYFEYKAFTNQVLIRSCLAPACSPYVLEPPQNAAPRKGYTGSSPTPFGTYQLTTYDERGNVTLDEIVTPDYKTVIHRVTYEYDDKFFSPIEIKPSDFKGFPSNYLNHDSKRNNLVKKIAYSYENGAVVKHLQASYKYEYNSEGYPTRMTSEEIDMLKNKPTATKTTIRYLYGCRQ